jgi:polyhydroxyalkanoate synthesis regulator phasin
MKSYPSPGDELARRFQRMISDIKNLKQRVAALYRMIKDLEERVTDLEP